MGRPLWLHISALSPDEYESYPPALEDIATIGQDGGKDWESRSVSVLVAKGWMRGRYREHVDGEIVDKVCEKRSRVQCDALGADFSYTWFRFYGISIHLWVRQMSFLRASSLRL